MRLEQMTSNVVGSISVPIRRTTMSHTLYWSSRSKRYRQAKSPPLYGSTMSVHSGKRLRATQMTASTATTQRTRNGVDRRPTLNGIATAKSRSNVMNTVSHADSSLVLKQQHQLVHVAVHHRTYRLPCLRSHEVPVTPAI